MLIQSFCLSSQCRWLFLYTLPGNLSLRTLIQTEPLRTRPSDRLPLLCRSVPWIITVPRDQPVTEVLTHICTWRMFVKILIRYTWQLSVLLEAHKNRWSMIIDKFSYFCWHVEILTMSLVSKSNGEVTSAAEMKRWHTYQNEMLNSVL